MAIVLDVLDFILLLLLVVHIPRAVWKAQPQGSGSRLLSIFMALALIFFAAVSFTASVGVVEWLSSLSRGIVLAFVLAIAALVRITWVSNPVA